MTCCCFCEKMKSSIAPKANKKKDAKKKKEAKKKKSAEAKDDDGTWDAVLTIGMRVMGKWLAENEHDVGHGDWYEGTISSVDDKSKTIHIKYDDGDEDTALSWDHVSIIE